MNLPLIQMCKTYCLKWDLSRLWGQDVKQIQEQLETIPWVKGAGWFVKFGQIVLSI